MIEKKPIQEFIEAIQCKSTATQTAKSSESTYLGRAIFFIQSYFTTDSKIQNQFDHVLNILNQAYEEDCLEESDISLVEQLKETLGQASLPDDLRSRKIQLLKLIDRIQGWVESETPREIITHVLSYAREIKSICPTFQEIRKDFFVTTAKACQTNSNLQEYLPKDKEILDEAYVKDVYSNLMKEINQFSDYAEKREELRNRYGSRMTIERLEEMQQWIQPKMNEQLIKMIDAIGVDLLPDLMDPLAAVEGQNEKACFIRNWMADNQKKLQNTDTINLGDRGMKALPKEIGFFTKLEYIYLGKNLLTTLPAEMKQLKHLMIVAINDNRFTSIPLEIEQIKKLRIFNVRDNPLESVSEEIENMGQTNVNNRILL